MPEFSVRTKVCQNCGVTKFLIEFHRNRKNIDGYRPFCKECGKKRYKRGRSNGRLA